MALEEGSAAVAGDGGARHVVDTAPYVEAPRVSVDVEYNTRDLMLYAVGIGSTDPRYVYEGSHDFAAFPTYPISLTFKGDSFDALPFPSPAMMQVGLPLLPNTKVLLDAEKYIEKVRELPTGGARLRLVGGVVGVHKKAGGALVEQAFDLVDERGEVFYKIRSGNIQMGARDFTEAGVSYSVKVTPPATAPWRVLEVPTGEHVASLFRLSGDYNPLHVDPDFARKSGGFPKPILHGLCTLGHVVRAALDAAAEGDPRRYRSVQLRFAAPVIAGQTVLLELWQASRTDVIFQARVKETGKVCINNGILVLNPAARL